MAPRDILPGVSWAESIIDAINGARVMVLVFSGNANGSPQIEREIERAVHKGLPVVPVRIEDTTPSAALEYFISAPHWLDAFPPPFEQHLGKLAEAVKRLLDSALAHPVAPEPQKAPKSAERERIGEMPAGAFASPQTPPAASPFAVAPPTPNPVNWTVAAAVAALLALGGGAALIFSGKDGATPPSDRPSAAHQEQQAFDDAMVADTVVALDAFLAKYPTSPLVKAARLEREKITRRNDEAVRLDAERKAKESARVAAARMALELANRKAAAPAGDAGSSSGAGQSPADAAADAREKVKAAKLEREKLLRRLEEAAKLDARTSGGAEQDAAADSGFMPGVEPPLPITNGDTLEKVKAALGTSQETTSYTASHNRGLRLELLDRGLIIFFDNDRKVYTVRFQAPFAGSVGGVRIGDSRENVVGRLGQPLRSWGDGSRVYYAGKVSIDYDRSNTVRAMFR